MLMIPKRYLKPRNELTPDELALQHTLYRHGFEVAAQQIVSTYEPFQHNAIRAWDNFPACMDKYPSQLKKPEDKMPPPVYSRLVGDRRQ